MIFIEVGNSSTKAVRPHQETYIDLFRVNTNEFAKLRSEMDKLPDGEKVVLSSVRQDATGVIFESGNRLNLHRITYKKLGAIKLDYKTPETLGIDRVLACIGAAHLADGQDVIVVDAGTACTIDFMTEDFTFRGGVIMPGRAVLSKGMEHLLPELPEVRNELPNQFPGRSTSESLQWGVYGGYLQSIYSFIEKYRKISESAVVYCAGGDGSMVSVDLTREFSIRVTYRKELVFDGIRTYLELNRGAGYLSDIE